MPDTPLIMAIKNGSHPNLVRKLIARSNLDTADEESGATSLHLAVKQHNVELVRQMLEAEANPNIQDRKGFTPLMWAVKRRDADAVAALLEFGADIELPDSRGRTPLMLAVRGKFYEGIRLLVEAGADKLAEDDDFKSVEGYAQEADDPEIDLMLDHQGQENDFVRIIVAFSDGKVRTAYIGRSVFVGCNFSKFDSMRLIAPADMFSDMWESYGTGPISDQQT